MISHTLKAEPKKAAFKIHEGCISSRGHMSRSYFYFAPLLPPTNRVINRMRISGSRSTPLGL